jgi:uncharacterized sulfatase
MYREPHQPYKPMPKEDSDVFADKDLTIPNERLLDPKQTKEWTREYYASIHAADRNIGRLLDKLDELKLTDNTIVLFSSDHGYCIGQHVVYTKGNGVWIAGGVEGPRRPNMFEENIRVPLIIRWPGVVKPGTEINDTVTLLDTFAAVLGMLKIPAKDVADQHGVDYSPLLRGESIPKREFLYGEYDMHNYAFASMRMIRTEDWKLVHFQLINNANELYDLKNDPGEKRNLFEKPATAEIREQLEAKLLKYQESIHDPMLSNPLNTPAVGGTVHAK